MSNKFTIINGNANTEKMNKMEQYLTLSNCWYHQLNNLMQEMFSGKMLISELSQDVLMKMALSGIKLTVFTIKAIKYGKEMGMTKHAIEVSKTMFNLMDIIFTAMGHLTPRNFMITFPIAKEYDGEKWQTKDYFYTMDALSKLDLDKPIGEDNILDLMWDYQNDDLREVYLGYLCVVSDLHSAQTGKSLAEQFTEDMDIPTYSYDGKNGNMIDRQTGRRIKSKKRGHLQRVK